MRVTRITANNRSMGNFIYLASQSPRRSQLLAQLGIRHELLLAGSDEDAEAIEAMLPNEPPARYVKRVTALKSWMDEWLDDMAQGIPDLEPHEARLAAIIAADERS